MYKKCYRCCGFGSRCLFDPGSGIGGFRIPDLGSRISDPGSRIPDPKPDSLITNFWVKCTIIIYIFMIFVATNNGRTKKYFSPSLLVGSGIRDPGSEIRDSGSEIRYPVIRDPGSGIWDGLKSGSGIRNKHVESAILLVAIFTFVDSRVR